jgi:hypothetical protein
MLVERTPIKNLLFIRLNPGDDVLVSLREAAEKQGIKNAGILSGVGSVISYHFHVVASSVNPPKEDFVKADKPADIGINLYLKMDSLRYGKASTAGVFLILLGTVVITLLRKIFGTSDPMSDAAQ